jgi:hypothetical protein
MSTRINSPENPLLQQGFPRIMSTPLFSNSEISRVVEAGRYTFSDSASKSSRSSVIIHDYDEDDVSKYSWANQLNISLQTLDQFTELHTSRSRGFADLGVLSNSKCQGCFLL